MLGEDQDHLLSFHLEWLFSCHPEENDGNDVKVSSSDEKRMGLRRGRRHGENEGMIWLGPKHLPSQTWTMFVRVDMLKKCMMHKFSVMHLIPNMLHFSHLIHFEMGWRWMLSNCTVPSSIQLHFTLFILICKRNSWWMLLMLFLLRFHPGWIRHTKPLLATKLPLNHLDLWCAAASMHNKLHIFGKHCNQIDQKVPFGSFGFSQWQWSIGSSFWRSASPQRDRWFCNATEDRSLDWTRIVFNFWMQDFY